MDSLMDHTCHINACSRQLTENELGSKLHREYVGGAWEEIGALQFNFIKQQGLRQEHYLLDVGCGSLRGGIHFARYLAESHYYGIDINASLVEGGRRELRDAGLDHKRPQLAVSNCFDVSQFGRQFDFAMAQSLFTHLPFNHIVHCLIEVRKVIQSGGTFFATFFESPESGHLSAIAHPGGAVTHYDEDPYHQSWEEMQWLAGIARLNVRLIGDWQHPRNQRMLAFSIAGGCAGA
jgi:ubiquinone/menaquinone biosynthesis C-methylase UbiE